MIKTRFYLQLILIGLCLSLLASCATMGPGSRRTNLSANDYLQLAATAQGPSKQAYLLQASSRLIQDRQLSQARTILNSTERNLPPNLLVEKQLISARLLIAYRQNDDALTILQSMDSDHSAWTRANQINWYKLIATAYSNQGNLAASIQERSKLTPLLPSSKAKKQNLTDIWQSVQSVNPSQLDTLLSQATSPVVRGWLSLAQLTDQPNTTPQQLMQQLQQWHYQFPNHPATALLPSSLRQLRNIPSIKPRHIALLLPLQGRYEKMGNAIRNGFFAAYYYAKQKDPSVPTISIVDTTNKNIVAAYQEALQKGADFVVGPLIKTNIAKLVSGTSLSVPTLALNSLPGGQDRRVTNLYQFGLSPLDEASQAAERAWNEHHGRALIIAPKGAWGEKIASAFTKEFKNLGGTVVSTMRYTNQRTLSTKVRHALNIDQASWRESALKNILREKIRFVPRRRKDIDMVFLVAQAKIARQIRPLLRFYYAGNIPVYATSTIFTGTPNPSRDHDLNGIQFSDMPWVLKRNTLQPDSLNTIRQRIEQIWPNDYRRLPKLFALGVDAYEIIPKLNKMAALPQFGTRAATGTLYLEKNHHIYRQLTWSQMVNGSPRHIQ